MRSSALALTIVLSANLAVAGCLDIGGEPLDPSAQADGDVHGSTEDEPAAGNASTDEDEGNGSVREGSGDGANATDEPEGQANRTDEPAAGRNGTRDVNGTANATYDPGWPPRDQARIRPGADIVAHPDLDNACTASFVFASPDNRTLYVGTAAHCLAGRPIGDPVMVGQIEAAGTIAYCSWGTIDQGSGLSGCPPSETQPINVSRTNDFALVAIDEAHRDEVHPSVMHWGGPRGVMEDAALGTKVHTFGNTPFRDNPAGILDPREGYVTCTLEEPNTTTPCRSANTTWARIVGHTFGGDSGSPVLGPDGQALGPLLATVATGDIRVGNLDTALDFLHGRTSLTVELTTAPTLAQGTLPATPAPGS